MDNLKIAFTETEEDKHNSKVDETVFA